MQKKWGSSLGGQGREQNLSPHGTSLLVPMATVATNSVLFQPMIEIMHTKPLDTRCVWAVRGYLPPIEAGAGMQPRT